MKKILTTVVAAAALSTAIMAGGTVEVPETIVVQEAPTLSGFYAGVAYVYADTNVNEDYFGEDYDVDGDNSGVSLIAGYDFNQYVAVEGRYSWLAADTYQDNYGFQDDVDGEAWSLFVKPQYPVTADFKVYGLLGYGELELQDSDNYSITASGFQYGAGVAYAATTNVEVFADYTKIADNDVDEFLGKMDTDAFTIGINYNF